MVVARNGAFGALPAGQSSSAPGESPWTGLRSRFLDARDATEQIRIFDLSVRAAQVLHRWAARYPLIRRVRVWPLALSVAAAAPFSSVDALIATARLSLWVFTLDDLFDEERVPPIELRRRAERYRGVVRRGDPDTTADSLALALTEVRAELAKYPMFDALGGEWADALCGTIDGMAREYEWRLAFRQDGWSALPSYGEYLETGLYSIGGPPHVWAALITASDRSVPSQLEHLSAMARRASLAIRLANDLRSYVKEVGEGKINSLLLLSHRWQRAGYPVAEANQLAEARVANDMHRALEELRALRATAKTQTGQPEAAVCDIAHFVCDFYTEHDYHTFSAERNEASVARAGA